MLDKLILISGKSLLEAATAEAADAGSDLVLGFGVAGLGLTVVFSALILLILITFLYPKFLKAVLPVYAAERAEKKAARKLSGQQSEAASASVKQAESVKSLTNADMPASYETDPALIAVITAAVAASLGKTSNGIVIKSLRRSHTNVPAWGNSGRIEQVTNRL